MEIKRGIEAKRKGAWERRGGEGERHMEKGKEEGGKEGILIRHEIDPCFMLCTPPSSSERSGSDTVQRNQNQG